jgi:hypothetical protein
MIRLCPGMDVPYIQKERPYKYQQLLPHYPSEH